MRNLIRIATERFKDQSIDQTKTARWYAKERDKITEYLADADLAWSFFVVAVGGANIPEDLRDAWTTAREYVVETLSELDRLLLPEESE